MTIEFVKIVKHWNLDHYGRHTILGKEYKVVGYEVKPSGVVSPRVFDEDGMLTNLEGYEYEKVIN